MNRATSQPSVWRTSGWQRALWVIVALAAVGLGASIVSISASEGSALEALAFVAVCFFVPAAFGLRYAFRARVELTEAELVIITTLSARRIPWAAVETALPEYSGVRVYLKDGRSIVAGAVQKSNVSKWLGRTTRADDLADEISLRSGGTPTGKHMRA